MEHIHNYSDSPEFFSRVRSRTPSRNFFLSNLTLNGSTIIFLYFFPDSGSVAEIANMVFSRSIWILSSDISGNSVMTRKYLPSSRSVVTGSAISFDGISFPMYMTMMLRPHGCFFTKAVFLRT